MPSREATRHRPGQRLRPGWAHIGVLRALEQAGIIPDVVSGASIGALVGAAYASDRLDQLEDWVTRIDWWEIIRYMDLRLGGVEGERLMQAFGERVEDAPIESLPKPFGAVATDLHTGREVWFQEGSLLEAVPGLHCPAGTVQRGALSGALAGGWRAGQPAAGLAVPSLGCGSGDCRQPQ